MILALWNYFSVRFRSEEGATMVEYGLIVALIAIVVTVGAFALGGAVNTEFSDTATCVTNGGPC